MRISMLLMAAAILVSACRTSNPDEKNTGKIAPVVITERTATDSDDPAIWIDPADHENVLVLGTDKGDENGGIYVFDLQGRIDTVRSITGLKRPNNVDVEYGLRVSDSVSMDIAVFTERGRKSIRVVRLPDMSFVDNGGIEVFSGEPEGDFNSPMGVTLFKDINQGEIYAIVSRKNGPTDGTYLWQYLLTADSTGTVKGTLVRKFGAYVGNGEIEAIAVDDTLGYVYYSDEAFGVRKYQAHPDSPSVELAHFGTSDFREDREGIAIWPTGPGKGFIIVSDQQDHSFVLYPREGSNGDPQLHQLAGRWNLSTEETDGCEVYAGAVPGFPSGLFMAMSEGGVFHFYDLGQLADSLDIAR